MNVTVTLDTNDTQDRAALARLFDLPSGPKTTTTIPDHIQDTRDVAAPKAEVPAPAPKAAAKPKPQPKAEPVVEEAPEEDLLGGEDFAALRKSAVDAATVLVQSTGGPARVKEALVALGAKRVSELADDQLEAFIAAIA